MKITIYTISDCSFSQEEKEYLKKNNLQFEEKNLETNREYLTEMLNISNNFAGTPVTKIEKDDGKVEILKGFTQSEFDNVLNLSPGAADMSSPAVQPAPAPAVGTSEEQKMDEPTTPSMPVEPASTPNMNAPVEPVTPQPLQQSPTTAVSTQEATSSDSNPSQPQPVQVSQPTGLNQNPASSTVSAQPNTDSQPSPQNQPHDPSDTTPVQPTPQSPSVAPQPAPAPTNDPLEAVLNDLQKKVNSDAPTSTTQSSS